MAKNQAAASTKAKTKSEIFNELAGATELSRKQIAQVFEELNKIIKRELGKKGAGQFTIPGLLKLKRVTRPATKAGTRPNPFKPGEMMAVKAKPARSVVKARALKGLNEMIK